MGGKWLELLKEIDTARDASGGAAGSGVAAGSGQLGAIQSVAPSLGVELRPIDARGADEIERAIHRIRARIDRRSDRLGDRAGTNSSHG